MLRVRTTHHAGLADRGPAFELALPESTPIDAQETQEKIVVRSGSLRMEIEKEAAHFTFWRGAEKLTGSGKRDLAYMKTDWKGSAYDKGPDDACMREQLDLGVGELIYGLGERFGLRLLEPRHRRL